MPSAPAFSSLPDATEVKAAENLHVPNVDTPPVVHPPMPNITVTDVYLVDDSGKLIRARTSNPFLTVPILH